ncbi:MAG: hypothetical protein WDN28_11105 [Chthoniobacter sp.]
MPEMQRKIERADHRCRAAGRLPHHGGMRAAGVGAIRQMGLGVGNRQVDLGHDRADFALGFRDGFAGFDGDAASQILLRCGQRLLGNTHPLDALG